MTEKQLRTLSMLRAGWTTAKDAADCGGDWALSQRMGDVRHSRGGMRLEAGERVEDRWVDTEGARVKAWRIVRGQA